MEYLIDQPMELNDEGVYICNVSSASGFDIADITVDVLGKWIVREDFFKLKIINRCTAYCSYCTVKIVIYID